MPQEKNYGRQEKKAQILKNCYPVERGIFSLRAQKMEEDRKKRKNCSLARKPSIDVATKRGESRGLTGNRGTRARPFKAIRIHRRRKAGRRKKGGKLGRLEFSKSSKKRKTSRRKEKAPGRRERSNQLEVDVQHQGEAGTLQTARVTVGDPKEVPDEVPPPADPSERQKKESLLHPRGVKSGPRPELDDDDPEGEHSTARRGKHAKKRDWGDFCERGGPVEVQSNVSTLAK